MNTDNTGNADELRSSGEGVAPFSFRGILDALRCFPSPVRVSTRAWIIAGICMLIALLPLFFIPLGPDEAMFFVSGERILQGGVHYRDIIDIKPPLIYHLYALGIALFGHSDLAIQIIDFLLQGLTCVLMARLMRQGTRNDMLALLAPATYIIIYVGQRFGTTAQPESYVALVGVIILQIQFLSRKPTSFFLAGIAVGLLAMTKFSLGILLVGMVIIELVYFRVDAKEKARHLLPLLGGFAAVLLLLVVYLVAFGALDDFLVVNRFVSQYLAFSFQIPFATWLNQQMLFIPGFFNDIYSQGLLMATLAGIVWSILQRSSKTREVSGLVCIAQGAALYFLLLLLSVVIEGKHFHYHYSRLYLFGAILGSVGLLASMGALLRRSTRTRPSIAALSLLMLFLLLFGPLSRYVYNWAPVGIRLLKGGEAYQTYYATRYPAVYPQEDLQAINREIQERRTEGDELFTASALGGFIHVFTRTVPGFKIYHSAFIISPVAPQQWKDSMSSYLLTRRPRFIVTQRSDGSYYQSGSEWDSKSALLHVPGVDSLLRSSYDMVKEQGVFDLYVRR